MKFATASDFRRIALGLPGATEGAHHGQADFRVGGRIFATLAYESKGCGVLLLTPEEQHGMVSDGSEIFSPVPGGWGRKGATLVRLDKVPLDLLEAALRAAWSLKARRANPTSSSSPSATPGSSRSGGYNPAPKSRR
jgi:hypothetical protein